MCCITKPFTGEIVVERSEAVIRSIELQLLRVETVGSAEGFSQEGNLFIRIVIQGSVSIYDWRIGKMT